MNVVRRSLLCVAWLCATAMAEDYSVLPRKPDVIRDEQTTFLVDFSRDGDPVVE